LPTMPRVPYIKKSDIFNLAEEFILETHPRKNIPVPIERIIECMGIDIVPIPQLKKNYYLDGCASADGKHIYVDEYVADNYESRYRFTLAHELGHVVLHCILMRDIHSSIASINSYFEFLNNLTEKSKFCFEWQANNFAGCVLIPFEQLQSEYENNIPEVRGLIKKAVSQGVPLRDALAYACDHLAEQLAKPFEVSFHTMRIQLEFIGFDRNDIQDSLCLNL